ncbi:MAG: MoxR family ATPase, partial [Gammaproteobacteria bacterium]|nr:MoxR family ATPase [Gammaproteobacteria bacterium]
RAPAKVQSALLEAMGERQITVGHTTYPLPELFMVMATQNPIEHEGTYPLPEAQLDRFLMHVTIDYPDVESEKRILELVRNQSLKVKPASTQSLSQADLLQARQQVLATHLAPQLEEYIVQFVAATRNPGRYSAELARFLSIGASPRATLALDRGVRAKAWLNGRDFVLPEDIQDLIPDVLRHRLILSFEAEAQGQTADSVVQHLLELVPVP